MHEIVVGAIGDAVPEGMRRTSSQIVKHGVPAHLRHLESTAIGLQAAFQLEPDHLARNQAQALGGTFFAAVQQHLHAHADTKQGLVGRSMQHGLQQTRLGQTAGAIAHVALTRQDDAISVATQHSGSLVTSTVKPLPAATCATACDTERKLPLP